MTPSPLWPDAMLYPPSVAVAPPMSTPTPPMEPSYSLDATGYMPTVTAPPPLAPPEAKKKESRRKRSQKKKTKADSTTTSKVAATATSKLRGASSTGSGSAKLELSGSVDAPTDEIAASASEDQGEAKVRVRGKSGELDESPATRLAFKNFYKAFRSEERHSFQKAEELALRSLDDGSLPESIHYKVYLELADLAKRSNRYVEARRLYQKVCQLQPYASQGWLEYSKLEEECGFMNRVTNILHAGLEYCTYSESLLTRAVKHQEKMGNLESARENLARLKHVGIDKVWRTVLEGALLESRAGNSDMARRVLKYLMHHVPWYGPLYLEAYKLERDQGHPDDALEVVQLGLASLPRYGPLWFGAFRLYEEMDFAETQYNLPKTMKMIERAKSNVSKELVWKVHLEAAQMLERTALLYLGQTWDIKLLAPYIAPVRERLVLTILTCPNNLRWKVWLAAGRMELVLGRFETARELFRRAHLVVQQKSRSSTLLDCVRLEEFVGETELARAVLCKARVDYGSDWKVWLESVLLEIRNCEYTRALEIADRALEIHTGTGRLWATLVQLQHIVGNDTAQMLALERALKSVPKSGEVWCEGGRIRLNPFSTTFDLDRARRCLYFAAKFTPQFGDSFVESLRIEILSQWLLPVAKYIWRKTKHSYLAPSGSGNLTKFIFDVSLAIAIARINRDEDSGSLPPTRYRDIVGPCRKKLRFESLGAAIDLTDIRLACANADPNYGSLWFHCRKHPTDTPRRVIEHAAEVVAEDLFRHAHIYLAAMVRRMAVLATIDAKRTKPQGIETSDPAVIEWETTIDTHLRAATSLADMLNPVDPTTGLVLLESTSNGSTFVTGLVELSRPRSIEDMPWYERRRAVFGTDALLP
jgi:tetratricopeptide (TPR) repeat protein